MTAAAPVAAARSGPTPREGVGPDPGLGYRVRVIDHVSEQLAGVGDCLYESPPQPLPAARALLRVLLGAAPDLTRSRWERPIAGGHRSVELVKAARR